MESGDPFLPPDADAAGALEVVPIHEDVDHEVESDGDPGDGCLTGQLCVAEENRCPVMVAMEERYRRRNKQRGRRLLDAELAYSWAFS